MKAEDTYLSPRLKENNKLKHMGDLNKDVMAMLDEQAEISFKAGIKEVVEWIKKDIVTCPIKEDKQWQAKLKEWGIDDPKRKA